MAKSSSRQVKSHLVDWNLVSPSFRSITFNHSTTTHHKANCYPKVGINFLAAFYMWITVSLVVMWHINFNLAFVVILWNHWWSTNRNHSYYLWDGLISKDIRKLFTKCPFSPYHDSISQDSKYEQKKLLLAKQIHHSLLSPGTIISCVKNQMLHTIFIILRRVHITVMW